MIYKNSLITGVHTGLGYALAKTCIDLEMQVYGVSRVPPEDLLTNSNLRFVPLDLRNFNEIPRKLHELLEGVSRLDLVLLNAGVLGEIKTMKETSLTELFAIMDLNVWANKILLDSLLGLYHIRQVVAISSGAAFNGSGGWGAYSISKSALNLMIRVYAHEHPETHFVSLAPGVVKTDMLQTVLSVPEDPRFEANTRIRKAWEESRVLSPALAATNLLEHLPEISEQSSGAYLDIRQM